MNNDRPAIVLNKKPNKTELVDAVEEKYNNTSLYTWVRKYISDDIILHNYESIGLRLYREDGFNLSYELFNEFYSSNDQDFHKKRCLGRIEEMITAIKTAKIHERIFIIVYKRVKGNEHIDSYLITRFADKEYFHETKGRRVKQAIAARKINNLYTQDYVNHFLLSMKVAQATSNRALASIITLDGIDKSKLDLLEAKLGSDDLSIISLKNTIEELKVLDLYIKSLSEEAKSNLEKLPYIGQPNYYIEKDSKVRIYVRNPIQNYGNGNAISFYLDTIYK